MNWKVFLKISSLVLALMVTVYSIYMLNSQHSVDLFSSLGISTSQKTFNWCPDRLKKIEGLNSTWSLEEKDRKWILQMKSSPPLTVDYLEIEKWLAQYCSVSVRPYPSDKLLELKLTPLAKLNFNDGTQALFYHKDFQVFQINELTFESQEMQQALGALRTLLKLDL
jgi:hypothetical protein